MEKYYKRKSVLSSSSLLSNDVVPEEIVEPSSKRAHVTDLDLTSLLADPGLRKQISEYHPNEQDMIRREYLLKGPCHPNHEFPQALFGKQFRRFNSKWFKEYGGWLEYSISKDAAFCLYCYLFKQGGNTTFVDTGFRNWKRKDKFQEHVGGIGSYHNEAFMKCENLLKQKQHIETIIYKQNDKSCIDYKVRLVASIKVIRLLLKQGLPFRGHDETVDSDNQGNFLAILQFLAENNEEVNRVVLNNAPKILKLTTPSIQKDIVNACALETVSASINDLGEAFFSILVDESRDISIKEQMVVAIRYVNKQGFILERVIGFVHVSETTSLCLKKAIDDLFSKNGLSITKLRGQGYDGASNMQGEFNGLKSLILNENKHAFFVHCFSHQLQLTLVAVAKNNRHLSNFFDLLMEIITLVGASCKRKDALREKQLETIVQGINSGEILTGRGLNQETSLKRPGDTRWGSHYDTLLRFISMFSAVVGLLDLVGEDGWIREQRAKATSLRDIVDSFDFIFKLHMMRKILGITNDLSKALQRKDQDIVNAMNLLKLSKRMFQDLREDGWDSLCDEVSLFCEKHDIEVPDMDDNFVALGRSRRGEKTTNLHYYRFELFYNIIDMQYQELENRFSEAATELLLCMTCLNPADSFSSFNKRKLILLAEIYDSDFSTLEVLALEDQLDVYIIDMRSNIEFSGLHGISELSKKMVETKKHISYPLVYLLITLTLILPVATASVERAFSAMQHLKNQLRNRMGDEWMSDCLVTYIEKDIFKSIDMEKIIARFQNMKTRRGQLP